MLENINGKNDNKNGAENQSNHKISNCASFQEQISKSCCWLIISLAFSILLGKFTISDE